MKTFVVNNRVRGQVPEPSIYKFFYITRPLLLGEVPTFSKTPPSPLDLKRGSTSPPAPSPQERAPTGKPAILYSQTSSRPYGVARDYLRNRVAIILTQ